jgi:hypothetical protein
METYRTSSENLVALESFDARAFQPDESTPRSVCAFVLTLAAIHNDFKDIVISERILEKDPPPQPEAETPSWGEHNGIRAHLLRLMGGLFHELLQVVQANEEILPHPSLARAVKHMSAPEREAWDAIVAVALEHETTEPLSKALLFIRNKVAFHYDCKEILKGYELRFGAGGRPYLSRGDMLLSSRFYFADAAAQTYFFKCAEDATVRRQFGAESPLMQQVNLALHEIVLQFVQQRGFAWKPVRVST